MKYPALGLMTRGCIGWCCLLLGACGSSRPSADADAGDVEPEVDSDGRDEQADGDIGPDGGDDDAHDVDISDGDAADGDVSDGELPEPIEVFFAETFDGWQPEDMDAVTITGRWQTAGPNWHDSQTIVDAGGEHGEVWRCTVFTGENMGFERLVLLGQPFEELWFSSDLYADPDFEHISDAGNYSGKMLFGFIGGGEIIGGEWQEDLSPDGNAWWAHGVWGSAGALMPYIYDQLQPGRAIGEQATIPIPRGYWVHITRRVKLNTPGVADGLFEVYRDGELAMQVTDIMMRSEEQGVDYGMIEGLRMSYFHGGSGPDFASPRDNFILIDNLMAFRFRPGTGYDLEGPAPEGFRIPIVRPTESCPVANLILTDELFTDASGTISCTGQPLLTIPPSGYTPVLKEISLSSGTIGFRFTKFEPGYDYGGLGNIVVRVFSGRGDDRTLLWSFGRPDAGYSRPEGDYTIPDSEATIEYQPGNNWGTRRGWILEYRQIP